MEWDDGPGLEGGGSQSNATDSAPVVYELDLEDDGQSAAAPERVAPAPAAAADPTEARFSRQDRTLAEIQAELTPLVATLRQRQQAEQSRPPFTPQQLDTDPNVKPSDLLRMLEWHSTQEAQKVLQQAQYIARSTLSEQNARGQFNAQAMGQGGDYDTLVNRYVAPVVQQNPAIDHLIATVFPGDPSAGRMIVAVVLEAMENAQGDLPKALKNVRAGLSAYSDGARDTQRAITRNAHAQAARVLPGAGAGTGGRRQRLNADDVWRLSDRDFDRMYHQMGRTAQ